MKTPSSRTEHVRIDAAGLGQDLLDFQDTRVERPVGLLTKPALSVQTTLLYVRRLAASVDDAR